MLADREIFCLIEKNNHSQLSASRCKPVQVRGGDRNQGLRLSYVNLTLSANLNELIDSRSAPRCHFLLLASQIRDPLTRPNVLAGFQLAESGSVPFLEALSQRAATEGDTWFAEKLAKHASDETGTVKSCPETAQ